MQSKRKPRLFWVSAIAPMVTVVDGGLFAYFGHVEKHGIQIEGTAIGRSFAIMRNYQTDGNEEMIAFGLMNIVGSFSSCYLTTGPFSKSAVNFNAGCRTAMSNIVMAVCLRLTLLFLGPLFSYTPLVALSAIIMVAMFGLIKYEEAYRFFKVDKFDFIICMAAFFGVTFISMDVGLHISLGLSLGRALLSVARPATCKLGKMPESALFRDIEQYPFSNENEISGILILEMAVTTIDIAGLEMLQELNHSLESNDIKVSIINPRTEVMEKMILSRFVEKVGKESFFLSIEDAVEACRFSMNFEPRAMSGSSGNLEGP
ncbi:hypothetical protein CRG98_004127 [Punica granatum]|uniref:STAS domain-containing protein n=1 Tax=Punica granatum TaxID=22663 RepID=A0A2I0L439_PUNGR|nr:hypothetical protein CRG98_004127 [Punica granatum]